MDSFKRPKKRMSTKTITIILSTVLSLFALVIMLPVTTASALNMNAGERLAQRASAAADKQSAELTRIQARADKMIQDRLTSLQNLLTRVQNDKQLSTDEKTSLTTDINTAIANLTALKTKIDADTDAATALADAKSIVTSYRIYVVFEPKIRLLVTIDNLQTASARVAALVTKVQTLLTDLKNQGKDTTGAQNALNDISTQLTSINTTLATDKALIQGVNVTSTNPQSVFVQVRKDLATVRSEFAKIRADFAQMRDQIKIILPKGEVTTHPTSASESAQ